jgi:hypothetical protein
MYKLTKIISGTRLRILGPGQSADESGKRIPGKS